MKRREIYSCLISWESDANTEKVPFEFLAPYFARDAFSILKSNDHTTHLPSVISSEFEKKSEKTKYTWINLFTVCKYIFDFNLDNVHY